MRIPNPFHRTEYLIQEPLGEGLTSHVYKAIRRHRRLHIEQTVALKVLNSKNEVRTLKNEIKVLSQIRSAHCVQLLGWEDLSVGPALVLEYLEGVSLAELSVMMPVTNSMIDEILAQVQDGLRDLAQHKICHGDLSPRNIFITNTGVVKLLDFGFSGGIGDSSFYGTPQILAPEVWLGQPTSLAGDLFSLGLIQADLQNGTLILDRSKDYWKQRSLDKIGKSPLLQSDPRQRQFLPLESQKKSREELGAHALRAFEYKNTPSTQKLNLLPAPNAKEGRSLISKIPWLVSAGVFFFFHQLQPAASQNFIPGIKAMTMNSINLESVAAKLKLDVRSHRWAALSLYAKNADQHLELKKRGYAPIIFKDLKSGEYEIHWKTSGSQGVVPIHLQKSQRIRIR